MLEWFQSLPSDFQYLTALTTLVMGGLLGYLLDRACSRKHVALMDSENGP